MIDYKNNDPRFGKPQNQVLIDTHTAEGVFNLGRTKNSDGESVVLDVENFSESDDFWGPDYPRSETPLRIGIGEKDHLGGMSAAIFPMARQEGSHGFGRPGDILQRFRNRCTIECTLTGGADPCGCDTADSFDPGNFMFNMIALYFESRGQNVTTDRCMSNQTCSEFFEAPSPRDVLTLP